MAAVLIGSKSYDMILDATTPDVIPWGQIVHDVFQDPKDKDFYNGIVNDQQALVNMIKNSGISNLHFHDLRHEAISRLFEKGLNPMEVSAISGHKSMQVLKRYTHIKTKYLLKKINKV